MTGGGDWEWVARCAGLTGPNGKHFCFHCKVLLSDTKSGKPHALHILPKYQPRTHGHSRVLPPNEDFSRTIEGIKGNAARFKAAGDKAEAKNFENCINAPLLSGVGTGGKMLDTYSCTPLHVSLGIGLQTLNIIEDTAIKLDKDILESEGDYEPYTPILDKKDKLFRPCQVLERVIQERKDTIDEKKERQKEIKDANPSHFERNGRRGFRVNSVAARKSRNDVNEIKGQIDAQKEDLAWVEKLLKEKEKALEDTLKSLETIKGPFKTRFDNVLKHLKLQRAAYHSGSLVGPDVHKLTKKENIKLLTNVFKPIKMDVNNGTESKLFSSHELAQRIKTLLTKFSDCYTLYTENRILCRHEVEILVVRCCSLGCWFPVNFPKQSLRRKFHLLTVEMPKQVRRQLTIGLLTEQTIESIHPYINKLDRMFASVIDKGRKATLVMRQQNMFSNTMLPWLK